MKIKDLQDDDTTRVPMHMIIYIKLIIWLTKSVHNMIFIGTILRVQEGATSKVLRHMSHHLGMPRIIIDTHHLMIIVDHHHLMNAIDTRRLMIVIDTSHHMTAIDKHHPMIFDDTPHDMVMRQDDDILDMKWPRETKSTTPIIWCLQSLAPQP